VKKVRLRSGTQVAALVVMLLMVMGFFVQEQITTGAFDHLEADQVAQDAQRVKIGLEGEARLLGDFGASNSIWDSTYDEVQKADQTSFLADFPPEDTHTIFGLDGILGVTKDGSLRVGGMIKDDSFVAPPTGLDRSDILARLFDPAAAAGVSRCGVALAGAGSYLFCGFAAHRGDGGDEISGGLIYLKAISGGNLAVLGRHVDLSLELATAPRAGSLTGAALPSMLGELQVATSPVGEAQIALQVTIPTVNGAPIRLEARRPRPIHQTAAWVAIQTMGLLVVVGTLLFGAVALLLRREISRQVRPLRSITGQVIEKGDRTLRIGCTAQGEIGALGRDIDAMLDAMLSQDERLLDSQTAREMELRATYVQQKLVAQHIRRRAQTAIDETATAVVQELDVVVQLAKAVQDAVGDIDLGVRGTDRETRQVVQEAGDVERVVAEVAQSLHRVRGITKVISEVAGQTKLLALNATIEAARAGAAGKGFRVVANEVKGLASTTTRSTEEIATTIAALDTDVAVMSSVITQITGGVVGIGRRTGELGGVAERQRSTMLALDEAVTGALRRVRGMAQFTDLEDRRRYGRVNASGAITLSANGSTVEGVLLDLSEGGLRCVVEVGDDVTLGTAITVTLPFRDRGVSVEGLVVRRHQGQDGPELGVEFLHLSAPALAMIREYVEAILGVER
jgi:methyl-accepting chemotaxis protein